MAGNALFRATVVVSLTTESAADKIADEIEAIAFDLMVDIEELAND